MGEAHQVKSVYDIGDLVVYKIEYRDREGVLKGKPRPLVIVSEPNSKGDYLAIVGSTRVHQWINEEHIEQALIEFKGLKDEFKKKRK